MTKPDVEIPTPTALATPACTRRGRRAVAGGDHVPRRGGVRQTFHEMAQQLADKGYAVLLPTSTTGQAPTSRSTSRPRQ